MGEPIEELDIEHSVESDINNNNSASLQTNGD